MNKSGGALPVSARDQLLVQFTGRELNYGVNQDGGMVRVYRKLRVA